MPSLATTLKVVVKSGLAKSIFGSKMVENTVIYSVCRVVLVDILIGKEVVDVIGQIKSPEMDMCHAHCLPSSDENEIAGFQRDGNRAIQFVSQCAFQRAIGCFDRPRSQNLVPAGLAMPIGQS